MRAKTRHTDAELEFTQQQLIGQRVKKRLGQGSGPLPRFLPTNQVVVVAESLALTKIHGAALVESEDAIHLPLQECGDGGEGAKGTICQHHIARRKPLPEFAKESGVVDVKTGLDTGKEGACGQGKQGADFHHRKTAAGLLFRRLRPAPLVGFGIRHGGGSGVDDFDMALAPQVPRPDFRLDLIDDVLPQKIQELPWQSLPSLAVGAGTGTDGGLLQKQQERLNL